MFKHVDTGMFLIPSGGSADPKEGTAVVIAKVVQFSCIFAFFQDSNTVQHYSGLTFHPQGDKVSPPDGTPIVLLKDKNKATSFQARDKNSKIVEAHYVSIPKGHWTLLVMRKDPKATYTDTVTVTTGYSKTEKFYNDKSVATEISAKFKIFGASLKYTNTWGSATDETWYVENETTKQF